DALAEESEERRMDPEDAGQDHCRDIAVEYLPAGDARGRLEHDAFVLDPDAPVVERDLQPAGEQRHAQGAAAGASPDECPGRTHRRRRTSITVQRCRKTRSAG